VSPRTCPELIRNQCQGRTTYQQVAVLTDLKGSFVEARGRVRRVGRTALAALAGVIPLAFRISPTYYHRVNLVSKIRRQSYLLIHHLAKLQPYRRRNLLLLGRTLTLGYFIPFGGIDALESIQSIEMVELVTLAVAAPGCSAIILWLFCQPTLVIRRQQGGY
jgi:hypothetical protein